MNWVNKRKEHVKIHIEGQIWDVPCVQGTNVRRVSTAQRSTDCADNVSHVLLGQAWISTHEQGLLHDPVGASEIAHDAEAVAYGVSLELNKCRLAHEIAAEEHAIPDLRPVEGSGEGGAGLGAALHQHHKAEPARVADRGAVAPSEAL